MKCIFDTERREGMYLDNQQVLLKDVDMDDVHMMRERKAKKKGLGYALDASLSFQVRHIILIQTVHETTL